MREYYDAQVIQHQREQDAEQQRKIAEARTANTQPNRLLMRVGETLENLGTEMQERAKQEAQQQQTRRAYR